MTRKQAVRCGLGLALMMLIAVSGFAQERRGNGRQWMYLGEANVDGNSDHDRIRVSDNKGRFRSIQLRVQNGAINFERVVVHYGGGGEQPVQIRSRIPAGGRSRAIDLPGQLRDIEAVELYYSRGTWSRKPNVTLYGRR